MQKKHLFVQPSVAAIMGSALVALATPASAESSIELSGQINRLIMFADDGAQSKGFFADNAASNTRFRFRGSREVYPGLDAGFLFEAAFSSNPSSDVSFGEPSISPDFSERHMDVFLSGGFGKVSLGQGDGAANGGMEVDLSGTTLVNYSSASDIGGGIAYGGADDAPAIGSTMSNLDFESRYDRLRYDTPTFGGIAIAVSAGSKNNGDESGNEVYEVAIRPKYKLGFGELQAALGYSVESRGGARGSEQTVGGSLSVALNSGFNVTVAYGTQDDDRPGRAQREYTYGKLGYKTGPHAVAVDYGFGSDFAAAGDEATVFGLGYVYTAAKWLEFYGLVKQHSLDRDAVDFDAVTVAAIGTRVRF